MLSFWVMTQCRLVGRASALKVETVCISENFGIYESTRRRNPEEQHRHSHCYENFTSHRYDIMEQMELDVPT
jgi:hypothetical protein